MYKRPPTACEFDDVAGGQAFFTGSGLKMRATFLNLTVAVGGTLTMAKRFR